MAKRKIYTAHINVGRKYPHETPELIAEGFNLYAFVFGWMWAFYHKLWWQALVLFLLSIVLSQLVNMQAIHEAAMAVLQLGIGIFVGFIGNDWRRLALERDGYITSDIVTGESEITAEQRFYERHFISGKLA